MKNLRYLSLLSLVLLSCIGSALALPTVTPAPSVTPVPVEVLQNVPAPLYVVLPDVLEVRAAPGETSLNVGYLEVGETVTVYIIVKGNTLEKCSAWARVGRGRWVCADRLERAE
jgi:hypothetical protein